MENIKKKAEELIRELVPELQELKAGCVVQIEQCVHKSTIVTESKLWSGFGMYNKDYPSVEFYTKDEILKHCKILGSEIHLEHLYLAFERKSKIVDMQLIEPVLEDDTLLLLPVLHELDGVEYELKPFENQSEEFYKFIVEILK